jgi:hypothetical protein
MSIIDIDTIKTWLEAANAPVPATTYDDILQDLIDGTIAEAEDEINLKLEGVTGESVLLDGGHSYLYLPHLHVSNVTVWEDTSRAFGSDAILDPIKYQVYGARGVLRIGKPRHKWEGGIAFLDKYLNEWAWDDFWFDRNWEGRREFLPGRQVIKVQYDGGFTSTTLWADLKGALTNEIIYRWKRRGDPGLSAVTYPDGSVSKMETGQWLTRTQKVLANYRRIVV